MSNFYIKRLKVVGKGKEDAEIIFEKGLNVIHGPSNTGKSYIFQCIDYAFGAETIKKIPEGKGYNKLYLEIRDFNNDMPTTILRFLDHNDIFVYKCGINETSNHTFQKLKCKHDPDKEDNISKFLLGQLGIDQNKYLVKNKNGSKVTLGFRAIVHLSLISETDIISDHKSPVMETQKTQQTYSKSVFRYLLTGEDDVTCVELEKPEIKRARYEAKIEYIRDEIVSLEEERKKLIESKDNYTDENVNGLDYYKDKIAEIENVINMRRQELHNINTNNNKTNLEANRVEMMLDKFNLLKRQYLSDVERLDFSAIGNDLLSQISTHHCPLCNSEVPIDQEEIYNQDVIDCCNIEKAKIQINLSELDKTITDLTQELIDLKGNLSLGEEKAAIYKNEITRISSQDLKPLKEVIKALIEQEKNHTRIIDLGNTINRKCGEIITFEESKKVKEESVTEDLIIEHQIYNDLCNVMKKCLKSCGYEGVKDVTFDSKTQDVVIDGVARLANGKGFRAFFYAVFCASLMLYLQNLNHPFTKVLVLDSPLTTLKESEISDASEDDFISNSLQDGLFAFFANHFGDNQSIIIDNKKPPKSLIGKYHDIAFTKGRSEGRYGFFVSV